MLLFALNGGRGLGERNRQTLRKIHGRNEVAAVGRHAADSDELASLAGERFCDDAYPSVSSDDDIEGASRDCRIKRLVKMRVGVNVLDVGTDLRNFVRPAVENRNRVSALAQAVCEKGSTGTGATDNQSCL